MVMRLVIGSICCAPDQNKQFQQSFDAVIMSVSTSIGYVPKLGPLGNVKEMKITKIGSPFLLNFIQEVGYMPISVIISTFKKENVKQPLEGFGVLVPDKEQKNGLRTLGTLFSSMMIPDRASEDVYLYTTFVGGSRTKNWPKLRGRLT
ncbi:putative protoporphyrinogen oxidase [Helianthus annuus]|nr:putative protoporphyrinogen oxidase [Helianthus annuus]